MNQTVPRPTLITWYSQCIRSTGYIIIVWGPQCIRSTWHRVGSTAYIVFVNFLEKLIGAWIPEFSVFLVDPTAGLSTEYKRSATSQISKISPSQSNFHPNSIQSRPFIMETYINIKDTSIIVEPSTIGYWSSKWETSTINDQNPWKQAQNVDLCN